MKTERPRLRYDSLNHDRVNEAVALYVKVATGVDLTEDYAVLELWRGSVSKSANVEAMEAVRQRFGSEMTPEDNIGLTLRLVAMAPRVKEEQAERFTIDPKYMQKGV